MAEHEKLWRKQNHFYQSIQNSVTSNRKHYSSEKISQF